MGTTNQCRRSLPDNAYLASFWSRFIHPSARNQEISRLPFMARFSLFHQRTSFRLRISQNTLSRSFRALLLLTQTLS